MTDAVVDIDDSDGLRAALAGQPATKRSGSAANSCTQRRFPALAQTFIEEPA